MTKQVEFTEEKMRLFKEKYEHAVEQKLNTFMFEGSEWLISYAKYVLEYLEEKFK